jgi:hypothetical protein
MIISLVEASTLMTSQNILCCDRQYSSTQQREKKKKKKKINIPITENNTQQRLSEIRIRGTVSARLVHASTNQPITVGCLQNPPIRFSRQLSGLVGR